MIFQRKKEKIIEDKNSFQVLLNNPKIRYFDSACVTLKPKRVIDKINEYYEKYPACAGRSTHFMAEMVNNKFEKSRDKISKYLNAKSGHIIFTRNTTESINIISNQLKNILKGKNILITDKEHNSNYLPWLRHTKENKTKLIILNCKENFINLQEFEEKLKKENIGLVSIHHASNIDGSIQDIENIVKITKKYNAKIMIDSAQSFPHLRYNLEKLDPNFLAFSGHKAYGPSGIGVLYAKKGELEEIEPFIIGGDTVSDVLGEKYELLKLPERFEAGLQDYSGIIGLSEAIFYLDENLEKNEKNIRKCLEIFFEELSGEDIEILSKKDKNCGIFTFIPKNIDAKELSIVLSEFKICTRAGAFCVHNWFNKYNKKAAIRFSLSSANKPEDIYEVCKIIKNYL